MGPCCSVPSLPAPNRAGWREALVGAPHPWPLLPTLLRLKPEPHPHPIDSTELHPPGLSFSAGPWKRPRQRLLLSGPARNCCSQDGTKPARSQPPGRMERFSVWIIRPQKACGPFASISWTPHPHPSVAFQDSPERKFPQAPKAGASPGQTVALASDTRCSNPPGPRACYCCPELQFPMRKSGWGPPPADEGLQGPGGCSPCQPVGDSGQVTPFSLVS